MQRIIIDTDPGVDDAHAIMLALSYPDVTVEAIMTVAGNVGIDRTTANALTILDVLDKDVPVYRGCGQALVQKAPEDASHVHGSDGLGDIGFPPSKRTIEKELAPIALVRMANEEPGEFTLVTIGPLTNIAVALNLDPDLPKKIKKLVVMGGAIHSKGNTSNLSAEFNIYSDPEAAHIVFVAWPEFTLVSWETTLSHSFSADLLAQWEQLETPQSKFFMKISEKVAGFLRSLLGQTILFGADILTMAIALEPSIIEEEEHHAVSVELNGKLTRGQTIVDWWNQGGQNTNAHVILKVNPERFYELSTLPLRK